MEGKPRQSNLEYPVSSLNPVDEDDFLERDWTPEEHGAVVFEKRFGPKRYTLEAVGKEVSEKWQAEVSALAEVLKTKDFDKIAEVLKIDYFKKHIKEIVDSLESKGVLSDEEYKLLSLSLWVIESQGRWRGMRSVAPKLFKGGSYPLSQLVGGELPLACLDSASLTEFMTHNLGIKGGVRRTKGKFSHRYWRGDSGSVIDTWWGFKQGGFFRNLEQYQKMVESWRTVKAISSEF